MSAIEKKNYNLGIALGKMLMCFEVVLIHFWGESIPSALMPFAELKQVAVPFFMIISFFLTERGFERCDPARNKRRLQKLIFVQIAWAVLYWLVYVVYLILIERDIQACPGSVKLLLWQIFTGHSPKLNSTMWFQTDLIVITLLVILLFRRSEDRRALGIMGVLAAACLLFQYSGLNYAVFSPLRYELSLPIGRLFEMIPMAFVGLLLARSEAVSRMGRTAPLICAAGVAAAFLVPLPGAPGFGYAGLHALLLGGTCAMLAISLPLRSLPERARRGLAFLTRHTMGIYCIHRMTGNTLRTVFTRLGMETDSFLFCLLIYLLSFLACELLSRMPWRWMRELAD